MQIPISLRFALSVAAAAVTLASCNSASQVSPSTANAQVVKRKISTLAALRPRAVIVRPDRRRAHMNNTTGALLYISDAGTDDVYAFSYPNGTLVGTLTGFEEPQGLCLTPKGDIWVVNTLGSDVIEYAVGGQTILKTLHDTGEYPIGCAVDTKEDLAVTNSSTLGGGAGSIAWYKKGNTPRTLITSSSFESMYFDGFDKAGNLFIDGYASGGSVQVGELPAGSSSIQTITVSGATLVSPGGVQVGGTTLAIGDQGADAIYEMSESGVVSGSTPLTGAGDCVQGTITTGTYICPDAAKADAAYFAFPTGGPAVQTISGLDQPIGSVLSKGRGAGNRPPEIFNFFQPYPCTTSGSPNCPTDFEVQFQGDVATEIPPTENLYGPYNPFCPPSQGYSNPCPPTVTYDSGTNLTTVEFSGATVYKNTTDCTSACVHFGLLASQNQDFPLFNTESNFFWTYNPPIGATTSLPGPEPSISIISSQPVSSSNWNYAYIYIGASTAPTGGATYGSWWAVGYKPNGSQQPKFKFENYGTQTIYVKSSGIILDQPVPSDPNCQNNPGCKDDMAILAVENTQGLPPPGTKGSKFVHMKYPPAKVLKPIQGSMKRR